MDSEFKGMGIEVAGCAGVKYRAIQLSSGCKRAAQVTMTLGPLRSHLQQPLICRGSGLVPSAVTEHPGTEVGYVFLLGSQLKGDACTFDGILAPSAVQQGFTEPAKEYRELILRKFAARQIKTTGLNKVSLGPHRSGTTYRIFTNLIEVGHYAMLS